MTIKQIVEEYAIRLEGGTEEKAIALSLLKSIG